VIAAPRMSIPVPQAVRDLQWSTDPADQARHAGVMLAATAACEDPRLREAHRHRFAADIARANKQLARTGATYSWVNVPGRKQEEYR